MTPGWERGGGGVFIPESGRKVFFLEQRCHSRLSSNTAQSAAQVMPVFKGCHKTAQSSAEAMAVFKDCRQRLRKVLLK